MTLRVVNLKAENFKRLKAIDITPEGDVVVVGGRNAQGKSSVLDAIWSALTGREAGTQIKKPIRDGESKATVTVDLGEYVVTRKWSKNDAGTLTVSGRNGAVFKSPQRMLDDLVGAHAFDPLAFTRMSAKDQVAELLNVVNIDVDLDEIAAERAGLFSERTQVGREVKGLGDLPELNPELPETEESATKVVEQIQQAQEHAAANADEQLRLCSLIDQVASLDAEIAQLQAKRASVVVAREKQQQVVDALVAPADVEALKSKLSALEATNSMVRANQALKIKVEQQQNLVARYEGLTSQIGALDKKRADSLATAQFPVAGLSFGEDGVTFNGVPFAQASSAEQLRVSTALAMAANPDLRVLRIMDGSLLDSDSLAIISELATTNDYQVWIEVVDESGKSGIVIEDGEVA